MFACFDRKEINFGSPGNRGLGVHHQNEREQQNLHNPQDYTGDIHHGFCGGGARIVGFDTQERGS